MTIVPNEAPLIALIDDDVHSARLLVRTLGRFGARRVKWCGDAVRGQRLLRSAFAELPGEWPRLVIVDLKSSSAATAAFLRTIRPVLPEGVPLVAMAATLEREVRDQLIEAGAMAVFARHAELGAYQREVGSIVSFLGRFAAVRGLEPRLRLVTGDLATRVEFLGDDGDTTVDLPRTAIA